VNYSKQTQSNPTCSELACPELACGELVEPVEGVEPISKGRLAFGLVRRSISEGGLREIYSVSYGFLLRTMVWVGLRSL